MAGLTVTLLGVAGLVVLLALSTVFSSSETAVSTVSEAWLADQDDTHDARLGALRRLRADRRSALRRLSVREAAVNRRHVREQRFGIIARRTAVPVHRPLWPRRIPSRARDDTLEIVHYLCVSAGPAKHTRQPGWSAPGRWPTADGVRSETVIPVTVHLAANVAVFQRGFQVKLPTRQQSPTELHLPTRGRSAPVGPSRSSTTLPR